VILELDGVSCGYGNRRVLDKVELAVGERENVCILGPNGVGKTTLFRTILGTLPGLEGEIRVDGRNVRRIPRRERARLMAYVPQAHTAPFPFKVMDVVLAGRTAHIGLTAHPTKHDEAVAASSLARMGIDDLAQRPYTELSGGERQLVLIARALAQEPKILIMDEPSSYLDFGNQARLLELVRRLVHERSLAVLMSSHFPNHAFACASKVALIHRGKLLDSGQPGDVLTEASLEKLYGIQVRILEGDPKTDPNLRACVARGGG
jgi:iron complex transport system ATP-binding protein